MIINIYKCDMCKTEHRDPKNIYEAKNGPTMDIKGILKLRYKINETCVECFNKIHDGVHNLILDAIK